MVTASLQIVSEHGDVPSLSYDKTSLVDANARQSVATFYVKARAAAPRPP